MNVINPDEWDRTRTAVAQHSVAAWSSDVLAVLALLDLARYGTVQWFPDTDPVDVPWARFARNTPEWVRCVDASGCTSLTVGRVYRVDCRYPAGLTVVDDDNDCGWYMKQRFALATADEATVTIDVPVAWARYMAANEKCSPAEFLAAVDACREALSKAGLL